MLDYNIITFKNSSRYWYRIKLGRFLLFRDRNIVLFITISFLVAIPLTIICIHQPVTNILPPFKQKLVSTHNPLSPSSDDTNPLANVSDIIPREIFRLKDMHSSIRSANSYIIHDLIRINGNDELIQQALEENWSGSGTEENPYIIEGLSITNSTDNELMVISNTTLHITIEGNYLNGLSSSSNGISLSKVQNIIVIVLGDCLYILSG